ncbi:DUF427 domain-containing protein [Nocardia bovistercoris]|uniref:DUF427 domain-containing protein n=1 Tax=Nocardia bovistercoris TaxID=2785916 RepID=A0A931N446_9NOCA|nr:DUF427 domain-containing protein [Nocardia bovistercoris]MBH0778474.1 DUF427 domain-containing protein [Nocardia bovistercoris]
MTAPESEPSGFEALPDYRVDIHARRNLVTAHLGDLLVARTTRSLLVDEQNHGLVFYFPRADVEVALRRDDSLTTRCPFKGNATYWRFDGDGERPLCWSYDSPYPQVERIRDHVAFYQDVLDIRLGVATPAVIGLGR